jgi:hypothetical protein
VNSIKPVSPSYATSRLGIAEAIDYLSNTDFHCIILTLPCNNYPLSCYHDGIIFLRSRSGIIFSSMVYSQTG